MFSNYGGLMASRLPIKFGPKPQGPPVPFNQNPYGTAPNQDANLQNDLLYGYKNLYNQAQAAPSTINFQVPDVYKPSADFTSAKGKLSDWTNTGGYSDEDVQNLRARAVSPIRAAYAGANREIERTRGLQGGYSPSYMALKAKMARESSAQMAESLNDANANIAEMVHSGKASALSQLAQLVAGESAQENEFNFRRTGAINDIAKENFNVGRMKNDDIYRALESLRGLLGRNNNLSRLSSSVGG